MINYTKELPQNTPVIQSEDTEQYSKSYNQQRHLEASFDIRGAACISDVVFIANLLRTMSSNVWQCLAWASGNKGWQMRREFLPQRLAGLLVPSVSQAER